MKISAIVLTSLLGFGPVGGGIQRSIVPTTNFPPLILNEVLFDPYGIDSQAAVGMEWVEIFATKNLNLEDFVLTDNQGALIANLPDVAIEKNSLVLLILGGGSGTWDPDTDLSDKSAAFFLGLTPGDYLGNEFGGVRIVRSQTGNTIDSVYWGNGVPPSGSNGDFFDISMSGFPMSEGDSLGREVNPLEKFSGTSADWDRHGGRNAAGPTPKGRNGISRFDEAGLISYVQSGINQVIALFGSAVSPGMFSITNSSVQSITSTKSSNSFSVNAWHRFTVLYFGVETTLQGNVSATFQFNESLGAVGYSMTSSGTLTSASGYGFSISNTESKSGFHNPSNAITVHSVTETIFTEGGSAYPFSLDVTTSLARVGFDEWLLSDDRVALDYGGAGPKTSTATTSVLRMNEGVYSSAFSMIRDFPIYPPFPGTSDSIYYQEVQQIETVSTATGEFGQFSTDILRYDVLLDGAMVAQLGFGQIGTANLSFNLPTAAEPSGSADYRLELPMEQFGSPALVEGLVHVIPRIDTGKLTWDSKINILRNGSPIEDTNLFVDPPVALLEVGQCHGPSCTVITDGPLCSACSDPHAANPPANQGGSYWAAAAKCTAVGAGVGAGAGSVVGGVAGGIGGAAVGAAVGAIGGPVAAATATAGGTAGATVGATVGTAAGTAVGSGIGFVACSLNWLIR